MASKDKERFKVYALIVMAAIAGVMAYFRFVRQPGGTPATPAVAAAVELTPEPYDWEREVDLLREARSVRKASFLPVARDIFAPGVRTEEPAPTQPAAEPLKEPAAQGEALRLHAVMQWRGESIARIGSRMVRQGDTIDAYTVSRIGRDSVELRLGDKVLVLRIAPSPDP